MPHSKLQDDAVFLGTDMPADFFFNLFTGFGKGAGGEEVFGEGEGGFKFLFHFLAEMSG